MGKAISVITSYPKKGEVHSAETVGVASYTKTLLDGIKREFPKFQIKVIAEDLGGERSYSEGGIDVVRVWRRGSVSSLLRIISEVGKSPRSVVVVSYEAHMVGGAFANLIFMKILTLLRISRKRIIFIAHQVPGEMRFVKGIKRAMYAVMGKVLFVWMRMIAEVVVFEQGLADRVGGNVIAHLIPKVKSASRKVARKKLGWSDGERVSLYFGYVAPYKGVLWLVENWPEDAGRLVIAGGINPNHASNPEIVEYIRKVREVARQRGIDVVGFVAEEDIASYYSACDLVVLPYMEFMGSSGPLSLALAYGKPVIMSEELSLYMQSEDFRSSAERAGLEKRDMFFGRSSEDFSRVVRSVERNREKYVKFSEIMRDLRSVEVVARKFMRVIEGERA